RTAFGGLGVVGKDVGWKLLRRSRGGMSGRGRPGVFMELAQGLRFSVLRHYEIALFQTLDHLALRVRHDYIQRDQTCLGSNSYVGTSNRAGRRRCTLGDVRPG